MAIGAIATGAAATSTSTITIITIRTLTVVKLAKATGGSTIRNTVETLPMATGERRIDLADEGPVERAAPVGLVAWVELAARVA